MNITDVEHKTTASLRSMLTGIKVTIWILIGALIPLFAFTTYGLLTRENSSLDIALLVIAISCGLTLPTQFKNMRKIKVELDKRFKSK